MSLYSNLPSSTGDAVALLRTVTLFSAFNVGEL